MTKIQQLRQKGGSLYVKGQVSSSYKIYKKMLSHTHYNKRVTIKDKINDLQGMVNMAGYLELREEALQYAKKIFTLDSISFHSILTLAKSYHFLRKYDEAIKYTLQAQELQDDNYSIYDILAEDYMRIDDLENSKIAGIKSLNLKAKNALQYEKNIINQNEYKVKPLNTNDNSKNIISFTLFGTSPKYCENAIINAQKVSQLYPNWTCRFYCSSNVPSEIILRLEETKSQVIIKEHTNDIKDMLFWRFEVMSDDTIDRYLVRDCDSVISEKEAILVNHWIQSKTAFHIIRDNYTHTDLILAGMFGGITGILTNIEKTIKTFQNEIHASRTHLDQKFLAQHVWPAIKDDVTIHDSCFFDEKNNSIAFPSDVPIIKNHHIGMNEGSASINFKLEDTNKFKNVKWTIQDNNNNDICTYHSQLVNNSYTANIPTIYVQKLKSNEYKVKTKAY